WTFAKTIALEISARHGGGMTAGYNKSKRPTDRVLVDYNQNAWGHTLASIYSVRPTPRASVATPVTRPELERGLARDGFRIDNVRVPLRRGGHLWKPLLGRRGRADLRRFA